jgi:hypothetical protein
VCATTTPSSSPFLTVMASTDDLPIFPGEHSPGIHFVSAVEDHNAHLLPELYKRYPEVTPNTLFRIPYNEGGVMKIKEISLAHFAIVSNNIGALMYLLSRPDFDPNAISSRRQGNAYFPLQTATLLMNLPVIYCLALCPRVDINIDNPRYHVSVLYRILLSLTRKDDDPRVAYDPLFTPIATPRPPSNEFFRSTDDHNIRILKIYFMLAFMVLPSRAADPESRLGITFFRGVFDKVPPPVLNGDIGRYRELALGGNMAYLVGLWDHHPVETSKWAQRVLERSNLSFTTAGHSLNPIYDEVYENPHWLKYKAGQPWETWDVEGEFLNSVARGSIRELEAAFARHPEITPNHWFGSGGTVLHAATFHGQNRVLAWMLRTFPMDSMDLNQPHLFGSHHPPLVNVISMDRCDRLNRDLLVDCLTNPQNHQPIPEWVHPRGRRQITYVNVSEKMSRPPMKPGWRDCLILLLLDQRTNPNLPNSAGSTAISELIDRGDLISTRLALRFSLYRHFTFGGYNPHDTGDYGRTYPGGDYPEPTLNKTAIDLHGAEDGSDDVKSELHVYRSSPHSYLKTWALRISNAGDVTPLMIAALNFVMSILATDSYMKITNRDTPEGRYMGIGAQLPAELLHRLSMFSGGAMGDSIPKEYTDLLFDAVLYNEEPKRRGAERVEREKAKMADDLNRVTRQTTVPYTLPNMGRLLLSSWRPPS